MPLIDANAQQTLVGMRSEAGAVEKAAHELETQLFRQILKESGVFQMGSGAQAEFARDQWVDVIAEQLSETETLGLAKSLQNDLQQTPSPQDLVGFLVEADSVRISSHYGERQDPLTGEHRHHHGVDIAAKAGSAIHSGTPGLVTFAGEKGGYGNTVEVLHADGTRTIYAHMSEINVKKGDTVQRGAELGAVGSTGRSTGAHLHLEVRRGKAHVDPLKALKHYGKRDEFQGNPASLPKGGSR